jgi:hypothetical protein
MALDNFTLHRYRAIGDTPDGKRDGEVFEATEDVGNVLLSVGNAERVPDDTPLGKPQPKRGVYKRRDLRAEP